MPAAPASAQVVIEHTFTGAPADGQNPIGSLVPYGSSFYGMTNTGGTAFDGTIFRVGADGTGYAVIHSFTDGLTDGSNPYGSLVPSGGFLYGLTSGGGSGANGGTVFRVNPDGTGFTILHGFQGGTADGLGPLGSPTVAGSVIYGMTNQGGAANKGIIFRVNTDGTGYQLIHSFTGGTGDGQSPSYSALVVSGGAVYGMTTEGGATGFGAIFRMNTDGTGFALLHSFSFGTGDGYGPLSGLTLVGSTLYGMTYQGGAHGSGTVFKLDTDGTGYTHLHEFAGGPTDGANPTGNDLTVVGDTLYGMTGRGGTDALGTILGMNLDGTGYQVLYSFKGGPADGANPFGSLIELNGTLYGTTVQGGTANDGTIFSFTPIPEPSSLALLAGVGAAAAVARRVRRKR